MDRSQDCNDKTSSQSKLQVSKEDHDKLLLKIYESGNKSVNKFYDCIFDFLLKNVAEDVFDNFNNYGKQKLIACYDKWEQHYLKKKRKLEKDSSQSSVEEKKESCWDEAPNPGGPTHTTNTQTTSKQIYDKDKSTVVSKSKEEKNNSDHEEMNFDTTNGAKFATYMWNQSVNDVEVRIPVKTCIQKGNQVKVKICKDHLKVEVISEGKETEYERIIDGKLSHNVRTDDSIWLLSPSQHISILLEKQTDTWWDRLLLQESPIDLKMICPERQFDDLPEEDRMSIEKVISNKRKLERDDDDDVEEGVGR